MKPQRRSTLVPKLVMSHPWKNLGYVSSSVDWERGSIIMENQVQTRIVVKQ